MRKGATAGLLALLAACGGSTSQPAAPELITPAFPVGTYWVSMTGYDIPIPGLSACDRPVGEPPSSKRVTVQLTVVKEGTEWVGRTAEGAGDITLRFRDGGELPYGLRAFTATLRGQAADTGIPGAANPTDVSIAIDGNATVDGQTALPFSARVLSGRATGTIRFTDGNGRSATCSTIAVAMATDLSVFTPGFGGRSGR
jgi:hypothetical protein